MSFSSRNTPEAEPEAENDTPDYLVWEAPERPPIHIHPDVVSGITQEVIEGYNALPKRGVEVGGLLLGQRGARIGIEHFESVQCEYRFGPSYVLSDRDKLTFDEAVRRHELQRKLAVIGYYRSHTRKGFQLEDSDLELIQRWFSNPASLFLLIKPHDIATIEAEFLFWERGRVQTESRERVFPFRGGAGAVSFPMPPGESEPVKVAFGNGQPESVLEVEPLAPEIAEPLGEPAEFTPVAPGAPAPLRWSETAPDLKPKSWAADHWEILAAIVLVAGAGALLWQNRPIEEKKPAPPPVRVSAPVPAPELGLEVRPGSPRWRISWNRLLPQIQNAQRGVLEVEDGARRGRVPLNSKALQRGETTYTPSSNDVTFRLEVMGPGNQTSSESFRVLLAVKPKPAAAPAPATEPPAPSAPVSQPPSESAEAEPPRKNFTPPQAVNRVQPEVPPGIRPRIERELSVSVKVYINTLGHVTRATPLTHATGLEGYLTMQALEAAKKWQFDPALQSGRPVPSSQVIQFVFEKGQ